MLPRLTGRTLGAALIALLPLVTAYRGAFIVEFKESNLESNALLSEITPAACQSTVRHQFTSDLFAGISFDLDCASRDLNERQFMSDLKRHKTIENVWPVSNVANPTDENVKTSLRELRNIANHPKTDTAGLDRRSQLDPSPVAPRQLSNGTLQSLFTRTGIDRLHESNITGAGIFIAIVDTGASVDHPALEGIKIRHKVNLVDNDDNIDPPCGVASHGTQMLGIMGGSRVDELGFTGIAPDATYDIYRIAPCEGALGNDVLIQASLMAADAGVNILATSYGASMVFPDDPWSVVMSRIMANGTFVAISSGNTGSGPFSGQSPAAGDLIASIGATHNWETPFYSFKATSSAGDLRFTLGVPFNGFEAAGPSKELTVWFPADGEANGTSTTGGCRPLPANRTPMPQNAADIILLVDWDTCWSDAGDDEFLSRSGVHSLMYYPPATWDETTGLLKSGSVDRNITNVITIDRASAKLVLDSIHRGNTVTVSVPVDLNSEIADASLSQVSTRYGGLAPAFSGWGPNLNGAMKPTLLAPGRMILAPTIKSAGSWEVILGTSFSCPFAAAVAALVRQAHPDYTAVEIKNVMIGTAQPVNYLHDVSSGSTDRVIEDYLAPIFQQGGGIVDAYSAVNSPFTVNIDSLNFNDTANRVGSLEFIITNHGITEHLLDVFNVPAASGYILDAPGSTTKSQGQDAVAEYAELMISPISITLAPGASATITVSVRNEPTLVEDSTRGSYFGGFVEIVSSADDRIRVPYTGFGTVLRDLPMIELDGTQLASIDASTGSFTLINDGNHLFRCAWDVNRDTPVTCSDGNLVPGFVMTWVTQSRFCRISIIDPTGNTTGIENLYTTGDTYDFWQPQGTYMYSGVDKNKAFLPAGTWVWKVEVLKLFANATELEDLEVWHSSPWTLEWTSVAS